MFNALAEVCNLFTPQECWNYFCEAGYGSDERREDLSPDGAISSPYVRAMEII
jgi:hypothetical protein